MQYSVLLIVSFAKYDYNHATVSWKNAVKLENTVDFATYQSLKLVSIIIAEKSSNSLSLKS